MTLGSDLKWEHEREWGFAPPKGEEWPPQVALTTETIERQQSNPFFSTIVDVSRMIHNSPATSDPEADYWRMVGMVELLTDMVVSYCWHQLGGPRPMDGTGELIDMPEGLVLLRTRARAVVGQLLKHISERADARQAAHRRPR